MKKIEAVIKPFKVDAIRETLKGFGILSCNATEIKRYGSASLTDLYRGAEYALDFSLRIKIEFYTPDDVFEDVLAAMVKSASSGRPGDGDIAYHTIEGYTDISTGQPVLDADMARANARSRVSGSRSPTANVV